MATVRAEWAGGGYDLHVVRGHKTIPLNTILQLTQMPAVPRQPLASDPTLPVDVDRVVFRPRFVHAPPTGDTITAHRVVVDTKTGQVEALPDPAPTQVENFIIDAVITLKSGGDLPAAKIRIHVHTRLTDVWLTPGSLSVRQGADGQTFSLLACFDNAEPDTQVMADITANHEVVWERGAVGPVNVDGTSGWLTATADAGVTLITARLPPSLGGTTATATARALAAWSALPPDQRTATRISGPPGPGAADEAVNVLILSEGFAATDKTVFEQLVADLVKQLRTDKAVSPFDLLKDSINYWRLFLPAPSLPGPAPARPSVSALQEMFVVPRATGPHGSEVPRPREPQTAFVDPPFTLPELVHVVGLPLPRDRTATKPALLLRWALIYAANPLRINDNTLDEWLQLSDRRLADEYDTALGLATGRRPQVDREVPARTLSFNPRRATRQHLDQFLQTVIDPAGQPIGRHWNGTPLNSAGKDRDRVIVLVAGAAYSGGTTWNAVDVSRADLVASALSDDPDTPLALPATPGRRVTALPHPIPTRFGKPTVPTRARGTLVHEVSHSFGLGDEYGDITQALSQPEKNRINGFLNVQLRETLPAVLNADTVRWRLPRLLWAARLRDVPSPAGANVKLKLVERHFKGMPNLAVGAAVWLREPLPGINVTPELTVAVIDPADRSVTISGVPIGQLVDFGPGSVLCVPKPAPAAAPPGSFAELIAHKVRNQINTSRGPLNAPALTPNRPCTRPADGFALQQVKNWPGRPPQPPRYSAWIIGVYEGGGGHACTVVHPAGICAMRQLTVPDTHPVTRAAIPNAGSPYPFCMVCQYILVDVIDASVHARLEKRFVDLALDPQPK